MKPWGYFAGALAAIALIIGVYFFGRSDGRAIEVAKQAAVEAAVARERKLREDKLDQVGAVAAVQETARTGAMREIYRESHTVTEKPVYRNVCADADGVRLLDQAAAVAGGADPRSVPAAAGTGP